MTPPCKHPWAAPTLSQRREVVKVYVGKGQKLREYEVHTELLMEHSTSFRDLLEDQIDAAAGSKAKLQIRLPDQSAAVFDAFVSWLYTGRLQSATSTAVMSYLHICQIYDFASSYGTTKLCNTTLDAFYGKLTAAPGALPYDIINYVYEHMPKRDSLRDLIIHVMVFTADRDTLDDWKGKLPVQFLMDLLVAAASRGIVPFEAEEEAERFVLGLEGQLCECYHEHRWEDSTEGSDSEGDGDEDEDEGEDGDEGGDDVMRD